MSLNQSANYSGASYLGNVKENWLFQFFNQDSYLIFDGTDDYIDFGTTTASSSINVKGTSESGGTGLTAAFWINFPDIGNREIIFASNSTATYSGYWIEKNPEDKIALNWGDDSGATQHDRKTMIGSTALSANTWYHVIITSTFATATSGTNIYINNVAETISDDGNATVTTPTYVNDGKAYIAREDFTATNYGGKFYIKYFAIWGAILDANNRTAIYNSGDFLSVEEDSGNYNQSSNLKAYWELNNGENFAQDLTGNISTGAINGAKYAGFLPLSYRDETIDEIFYHGVIKSSASIRHSVDLLKSRAKTSNISLKIINAKYQGSDLSKEIFLGSNNYFNRTIRIFSQLNSVNNIDDCLQLYHGRLTNISHDDNSIKISIVSKSPWDNITVPSVKSPNGRLFPIAYGNFVKNSSSFGSENYAEGFKRQVWPVQVDSWGFSYKCLFHKDIGSTDTTLHYYEESIDAFLPLADLNDAESYGDGYIVKTKWDLKRHFKFKAIDVPIRSSAWDNTNQIFNAFDGITDESSTSTPSTFALADFTKSEDSPADFRIDAQYDIPAFDDQFDSFSSSQKNGLELQIRFLVDDFYATRNYSGNHATNSFTILDNSRYGGSSNPTSSDSISDGAEIFNHNVVTAVSSSTESNVSEQTVTHDLLPHLELYANSSGQYEDGFWLRFKRSATRPGDASGGTLITLKGTLKVYDVRFKTTLRVRNFNSTAEGMSRIKDVEKLYSGADGFNASWDDDLIDEGHDAHRDLLIRFAGMPTIEPINWSDLDSDRTAWFIKYWLNEEIALFDLLEKLQYEFGFIHYISPSSGKSKYVWVHGTGTNNAFRAEDVNATLKKQDISSINISTTSIKDILTKAKINTFKHPARGTYINETTSINAEPRKKYNIKSAENIPTINLDALFPAPATSIATDKQDDFFSYYSQINGDIKKIIECDIVNIQKAYLLEVGDIVKFDDMVVEPFGSDWNNYYMIVSITRSMGQIKIIAREVG